MLGIEKECNYFFDKARCIFLEEPELGIHPHQLNKLMQFIIDQAQTKQILLTTHSPQVLDFLKKDQLKHILLCSKNQNKGTKLRHLTKQEITRANKFLEKVSIGDYWQHSYLEDDNDQK